MYNDGGGDGGLVVYAFLADSPVAVLVINGICCISTLQIVTISLA